MPPEAAQIVRDNIEWSTPTPITPKVQALFPHITGKQIHQAWTEMSEVLWKKDPIQLTSAQLLLQELGDDIDLFHVNVLEGVEQLCWGMKKIAWLLKGKVVEVGIDATCKGITMTAVTEVILISNNRLHKLEES